MSKGRGFQRTIMLSTIKRVQWKPYMIYLQLHRRVALTPFNVGQLAQADRNLSPASRASARSVVRTAPKKGHREALNCLSFIGRQIVLPNRILIKVLNEIYCKNHALYPHR